MTLTATTPALRGNASCLETEPERWQHTVSVETQTDAELLRRFIAKRDEAAFTQMVRRHGPMVLRTCQRVVGQAFDADDAFQAAFMVLVRKASSIQPPEMLGPWLHGVACRCSLALKHKLQKQQQREHVLEELVPVEPRSIEAMDWLHYLDQEIERLPAIYRQPVVLCELEGRGRKEAATLLGVAEGTLSSRLASARKRLAKRLEHRGLLSIAVLGSWAAMNNTSFAALPETLVQSTTQLGMKLIVQPAAMALSPSVAILTQGALQSMFITKIKTIALVAIGVGCLSYGCWFAGDVGAAESKPHTPAISAQDDPADPEPQDKSTRRKKTENEQQETIVGSGKIVTAQKDVSGFNSIQLMNAGKLTIKQTGKEKFTLKTDDNLLPFLVAEVDDKMLVLKTTKQVNLKPSKDNEYTIEVKELAKFELKGAGTIKVEGLDGKQFEVNVLGAGTIHLEGHTGSLTINLAGAAEVDAAKLTSDKAKVTIPGSGSIIVNAKDSLIATINGAGSIQYLGSPDVSKTIQGVGSITKFSPKSKDPAKP